MPRSQAPGWDGTGRILLGVYTVRSSDRPVGLTGLSDWSVRQLYGVNAWFDQSDRRSEESNMFDFVRLPIRLSKREDTTSDWSDRPASRTTNHASVQAVLVAYVIATQLQLSYTQVVANQLAGHIDLIDRYGRFGYSLPDRSVRRSYRVYGV